MAELMRDTFFGSNPGEGATFDLEAHEARSRAGGVGVEFYFNKVQQKDYLKLVFPGDRQTVWNQPVREKDKRDYAMEWRLYQEGKDQTVGQTRLEDWGEINDQGSVEVYKSLHIRTVEQLAHLSDVNMGNLPPGATGLAVRHREMAQEYVAQQAQSAGFDQAITAAQQSQDVATAALEENKELRRQLEEIRARMDKEEYPKIHKKAGPKTTYQLSDGQIIQGKQKALEAQAILDESA